MVFRENFRNSLHPKVNLTSLCTEVNDIRTIAVFKCQQITAQIVHPDKWLMTNLSARSALHRLVNLNALMAVYNTTGKDTHQ